MRRTLFLISIAALFLAGCSLAEDVTPPPGLATAQAARLDPAATSQPLPLEPKATGEPSAAVIPAAPTGTEVEQAIYAGWCSVQGVIRNASSGGVVPVGLEVTLHGFDGQQKAVSVTTLLGQDGEYLFEDLEIVPERLFFVTLEYQGVVYQSNIEHLPQGMTVLDLPVTIFETTRDTGQVRIDQLHLLFDFSNRGVVQIIEMWVLSNRSDRMLVAKDDGSVLQVSLPQGATNLYFEEGSEDRFKLTKRGFAFTASLAPGMGIEQLVFSFDLPYDRRLVFKQTVGYPVEAVVVLIPENGIEVQGDGLQDRGDLGTIEGLHSYTIGPFSPGDTIALDISGRPSLADDETSLSNIIIGVSGLGAALIIASLWWHRAGSGGKTPARVRGKTTRNDISDLKTLLRAIAVLDDDFEAGNVSEGEYHQRREALKLQALDIMRGEND